MKEHEITKQNPMNEVEMNEKPETNQEAIERLTEERDCYHKMLYSEREEATKQNRIANNYRMALIKVLDGQ